MTAREGIVGVQLTVAFAAVAVEADMVEIDHQEKCTKQLVETVVTNVKFHSNQAETNQFIVTIASKITNQQETTVVEADMVEAVEADMVEIEMSEDEADAMKANDTLNEDAARPMVKATRKVKKDKDE